ncbi:ABC transporter substrate-binding protein [Hahella ganghwensis]|uniref:ABC transporter substrate-binding protein n=1 Tax=Hahella ganghwensis TaxID=286420 RepID=UPI0012FB40E5|nr:ABC transporter substrate-binding protein [Hahella ganghwensis]
MSVNQCVDQMLGYLAPEQLSSVSWLSHQSNDLAVTPVLKNIPANHGEIEEVIALQPDMIIGGQYGAPGLKALATKFGFIWHELPLPLDFPALHRNWNQLGEWLQAEDQAQQMIRVLEEELQSIRQELGPMGIRAVVVNANGWVAGANNFQDAYLSAMGLHNVAIDAGVQGWGQVSLEQLIYWQPDLIIIPESHYGGEARATQWMNHPVLKKVPGQYPVLKVDAAWLSCGTPAMLRAARAIWQHIREHAGGGNSEKREPGNVT